MTGKKQQEPVSVCQAPAPIWRICNHTGLLIVAMAGVYAQSVAAETCVTHGPSIGHMQMSGCLAGNSKSQFLIARAESSMESLAAESANFKLNTAPSNVSGPVIEALVAEVLLAHPSVQSQKAQLAAAQSGVDAAQWQFFPTPGVSVEHANAGSSDLSYRGDSMVTVFRLQQPIWTWGRLTAGLEKAQANARVVELSGDDARQQLAIRVVQSYGDWLVAYLKTKAWKKSEEVHDALQQHVRRRITAGAAAESDFKLSEGRMLSIRADISTVAAQHSAALTRLGELLGREISDAELASQNARLPAALQNIQKLLQQAEESSPMLKRAVFQVRAAEAEIDERKAELLPELSLRYENQRGNYSYSHSGLENRVFVGLASRFGAGLSSLSGVSAASARRDSAREEQKVAQRELRTQIMADHSVLASVQSRLSLLENSLISAKEVADSYLRQFLAGKRSWLDVMNAAREVTQIEIQHGDAIGAQVVLSWRLYIMASGLPALGVSEW